MHQLLQKGRFKGTKDRWKQSAVKTTEAAQVSTAVTALLRAATQTANAELSPSYRSESSMSMTTVTNEAQKPTKRKTSKQL